MTPEDRLFKVTEEMGHGLATAAASMDRLADAYTDHDRRAEKRSDEEVALLREMLGELRALKTRSDRIEERLIVVNEHRQGEGIVGRVISPLFRRFPGVPEWLREEIRWAMRLLLLTGLVVLLVTAFGRSVAATFLGEIIGVEAPVEVQDVRPED